MNAAAARNLPESTLILAAQARDRTAFTELVRRREGWLRALLRKLSGDPQLADDLAQETLLRAWQRLGRLREPRAFGVWLRRLAVNLFIDAQRLKQADFAEAGTLDELASTMPSPSEAAQSELDLEHTLALLSAAERLCIVLNLGEGMSHAEIEHATAIPLGTVKSHILRGTTKLRRLLGEDDE
jgi:RNA polymerase sigma-70 factor (ECF subfamily)